MGRNSQDNMRNMNLLALLRCVRDNEPVSKNELKSLTGLSWGSVSAMTAELVRKRVLSEAPKACAPQVGRTPLDVRIDAEHYCFLGVELNIGGISAVLMNLNLQTGESVSEPVRDTRREAVLAQAFEITDRLIGALGERREALLGIGVAMQGVVDSENGISRYSPYFRDWKDVPLKRLFEDRYGVSTWIDHSPNCQALYEQQLGVARGYQDIVYVRIGAGVGMSVIVNGTVWRGADSNAGELGHVIVEPDGRLCACGKRGCLETVASTSSLLSIAREHIRSGGETLLTSRFGVTDPDELRIEQICEAAACSDPFCEGLFRKLGVSLGTVISTVINLLNPPVIIFGGTLAQYEDLFLPSMREMLARNTWDHSNRNIVFSKSYQNTAIIGAALNVANRFYDGEFEWIFSRD